MLQIADTAGQVAYVREEYLIAVIVPGLLAGSGDGKCRVVFVGGIIEVTRQEAQRVLDVCGLSLTGDAARRAGAAAAN